MRLNESIVIGLAVVLLAGCSKKDSGSDYPEQRPAIPQQALPSQTPPISGSAQVVIPDHVKGRWKAVKLLVENREVDFSKEYTVLLGSELAIPDSNLVVRVGEFLPDLKIEGDTFTSASSKLLNPSIHVRVTEKDKEVFNGWLFQLFPAVHPFRYKGYNITLINSIPTS